MHESAVGRMLSSPTLRSNPTVGMIWDDRYEGETDGALARSHGAECVCVGMHSHRTTDGLELRTGTIGSLRLRQWIVGRENLQ